MTLKAGIECILSFLGTVWSFVGAWLMIAIPYYFLIREISVEEAVIILVTYCTSGLALIGGFAVNNYATEATNHPGEEHVT